MKNILIYTLIAGALALSSCQQQQVQDGKKVHILVK